MTTLYGATGQHRSPLSFRSRFESGWRDQIVKENIMKVEIEIRPGEGGMDANLLTNNQAKIYLRHAERNGLKAEVIDEDEG